jgi:hypothetical protein
MVRVEGETSVERLLVSVQIVITSGNAAWLKGLPFSPAELHHKKRGKRLRGFIPGISPKVLLRELIRTGCVLDLGNRFYRALRRLYVPQHLSCESIPRLAKVFHNVIETLEVNFRRSARIGPIIWWRLKKYVQERGQHFADDIDNWLSDRSEESHPHAVQTGIGLYHCVVYDEEDIFSRVLQR